MSELEERVARAIAEEQHKSWLYDERTCSMCDPERLKEIRKALMKAARAAIAVMRKPVYRVKMGRQTLNSAGLKLFDPSRAASPWLFEPPTLIHEALK